jgi:hypothetical protein
LCVFVCIYVCGGGVRCIVFDWVGSSADACTVC